MLETDNSSKGSSERIIRRVYYLLVIIILIFSLLIYLLISWETERRDLEAVREGYHHLISTSCMAIMKDIDETRLWSRSHDTDDLLHKTHIGNEEEYLREDLHNALHDLDVLLESHHKVIVDSQDYFKDASFSLITDKLSTEYQKFKTTVETLNGDIRLGDKSVDSMLLPLYQTAHQLGRLHEKSYTKLTTSISERNKKSAFIFGGLALLFIVSGAFGVFFLIKRIRQTIRIQKQVREELRENEARLQLSLDAAQAGTWIRDLQSGEVVWDDTMQKLFGYNPGGFDGTFEAWKVRVHPEDVEGANETIQRAMREGGRYSYEYRVMDGAGGWRHVRTHALTTWGADGEPEKMMGFCNDITERKLAEEERERNIRDLKHALDEVRTLKGLIPICATCKKIRDDKGYWNQIEAYISDHSEAEFTHGICPDCAMKLMEELEEEE